MKNLGERMKSYEKAYSNQLLPNAMFVVRLDGRGFSKSLKKWDLRNHLTLINPNHAKCHYGIG